MTYEMGTNSEATAVASGVMITALIDLLIKKGVVSKAEVGEALHNAFQEASGIGGNVIRSHAPQVVASVMRRVAGER